MPRRLRVATGGLAYHVLNRSVRREPLFKQDADFAAFERVLAAAVERRPGARLLGYCVMSNHWHLVLWPRADDDVSELLRWLTVTHSHRWHAAHKSLGTGPVYQGRFKSFPVQSDEHLLTVLRYVERNPVRAGLVNAAEEWRWSSLWSWVNRRRSTTSSPELPALSEWPVERPRGWVGLVNDGPPDEDIAAVQRSALRGTPYGGEAWVRRTAERLHLESTLRPRGRPRKPVEQPAE